MEGNELCKGSDSGATLCCCKCRQANWACTACKTSFTRKHNAERHVRNIHQGEAVLQKLGHRRAILEPDSSLSLTNSAFAPARLSSAGAKARKLLDEQSEAELESILRLVNRHAGYPFVNLAGRVCSDCLKVVLEGEIVTVSQKTTIPRLGNCVT